MADSPKRFTQCIGAIGATLGGFSLGTVIGWSSSAQELIKEQLNVGDEDISWVSSIMPLGAAAAQIYMAITLDIFGRKLSMLMLAVPFILGWLVIIFANSILLYCVGRFITGFCGGSYCVVAPAYIGEIADKGIRGTLSTLLQFLIVIGILLSYALGLFNDLMILTVPLCAGPIALFVLLLFLPESPVFLYKKGKVEKAQQALQFFRGKDYNIASEMKEIEEYTKGGDEAFWKRFKTRACVKAFIMLLTMHSVQQLSGINAVMFYAHKIFIMAGSTMSAGLNATILGIVQVLLTSVTAAVIDKAGRKILWLISLAMMGICLVVLGIYFMIKRHDEETAENIAWLPLIVICIYLAGFSLGAGPLPWVMIAEFLPNAVKGYIGSFILFFNWMLAFAITTSFTFLVNAVGADTVFWAYAVICGLGFAFVVLVLIETKNKSLEEIQTELGTPPS